MLQRYLFCRCRCRFLFTCTFGIHIRTARSCGPAGLYVLYLWSVTVILCYWLVRHFIDVQFSVFVFETCVPASIQMTLRQHQPEGLSIVLPLLCVVVLHFAYSICGKSAMGAHGFFASNWFNSIRDGRGASGCLSTISSSGSICTNAIAIVSCIDALYMLLTVWMVIPPFTHGAALCWFVFICSL